MSKARSAALVDAGVFLQLAGDLKGARDLFARALALDPQNTKAQHLLAAAGGESPPKPAPAVSPPAVAPSPLPPPVPSPPREPLLLTRLAPAAAPLPLAPSADLYATQPGDSAALSDPSLDQTIVPSSMSARSVDSEKDLEEVDAFLKYGMYDKALDYTMRVLRADPENITGHEKAYAIMLASGHRQLALDQLLNVLRLCAKRADGARAQPYLETLKHERPDHPELPGFLDSLRVRVKTDKYAVALRGPADATIVDVPVSRPPSPPAPSPSKKKKRRS